MRHNSQSIKNLWIIPNKTIFYYFFVINRFKCATGSEDGKRNGIHNYSPERLALSIASMSDSACRSFQRYSVCWCARGVNSRCWVPRSVLSACIIVNPNFVPYCDRWSEPWGKSSFYNSGNKMIPQWTMFATCWWCQRQNAQLTPADECKPHGCGIVRSCWP